MKKIRIFTEQKNLDLGIQIKIVDGDFEYLTKVMRQKIGDKIFIFNGLDGEFAAEILSIEKKFLLIQIFQKISDLKKVANITLAFALIKSAPLDFVATKATELGVARFQPLFTQRTIIDKINLKRFVANVKEACEQCQRNDFPQILPPQKLSKILSEAKTDKKIYILCDESNTAEKASKVLANLQKNPAQEIVILIGPEGGFCDAEFAQMRALKNVLAISLGSRILRADTAAVSALTLVQEFLGDF